MSPRILVLNDDQTFLELVQDVLEEEGYETLTDHRVDVSLDEVTEIAPDLIILDLLFRREPAGLQFLQKLKLQRETEHIPVLVCSAAAELVCQLEGRFAEPGLMVLLKPFSIDELIECVERMLNETP